VRSQPPAWTAPVASSQPSRGEASAQVLDDDRAWLDSGDAQGVLEAVDESLAERRVLLGALYERIELRALRRFIGIAPSLLLDRVSGALSRALGSQIFLLGHQIGILILSIRLDLRTLLRHAALANLAVILPGTSRRDRVAIVRRMMRSHNRMMFEFFRLPHLGRDELMRAVQFEGREHLERAVARGRGVVITSTHVGNWELAAVVLAHGSVVKAVAMVILGLLLGAFSSLVAGFGLANYVWQLREIRTVVQLLPTPFASINYAATRFFVVRLIVYFVFFAACLTFINNERRLEKVVWFVVIFGAVLGFFGILQLPANPRGIYGLGG